MNMRKRFPGLCSDARSGHVVLDETQGRYVDVCLDFTVV